MAGRRSIDKAERDLAREEAKLARAQQAQAKREAKARERAEANVAKLREKHGRELAKLGAQHERQLGALCKAATGAGRRPPPAPVKPTPKAPAQRQPTALAPISAADLPRDLILRAYTNTSFSGDRRADGERLAYVAQMERLRAAVLDQGGDLDAFEAYRRKWLKGRRELYTRHSGLASAMIVGPARFPAERQRKAHDLYQRKAREFLDWDEKQQRRLLGKMPAVIRSTDAEALPKLREKLDDVQHSRELAKEGNKIIRRRSPDEAKIAALEAIGYDRDIAQRAVTSGVGQVRPGFNLRNLASEAKRIEGRIAEIEAHAEAKARGAFEPYERGGWSVTMDAERVRVRGPKPEDADGRREMSRRFKRRGFVWSRKNSAYQRQANANGWAAARMLVDEITGGA